MPRVYQPIPARPSGHDGGLQHPDARNLPQRIPAGTGHIRCDFDDTVLTFHKAEIYILGDTQPECRPFYAFT